MAGLFYLPRLCLHHCGVSPGSEASELFKVMERRLMAAIMRPAVLAEPVIRRFAFLLPADLNFAGVGSWEIGDGFAPLFVPWGA
jgi:uncharacterized membrane protein